MNRALPLVCALAAIAALGSSASGAGPAVAADSAYDSALDGVWVGYVDAKSSEGTFRYPLLLNLDADAAKARGALLAADNLTGAPTEMDFVAIENGTVKGKKLKLTFTAAAAGESRFHPYARSLTAHSFVLKSKKGQLKGKMKSSAPGLKQGKVTLAPLDEGEPLQQVWVGTVGPAARGAAGDVLALYLFGDGLSGAGFVGDNFGHLDNLADDGAGGLTGTLVTDAGDIQLDLQRSGRTLTGTASGAVAGDVSATAGASGRAAPTITAATPAELDAGRSTQVELTGTDLVDGMVLHLDDPDVYAGPIEVTSPTKAMAMVSIPDGFPAGTDLGMELLTSAGDAVRPDVTLRTGGAGVVTFDADIQPVFVTGCALPGCHVEPDLSDPAYSDGGTAAGDMILSFGRGYNNIVNRPSSEVPALFRIEPNNPDDSYMIRKLRGEAGIVGARMPFGGPYLSEETIQMFVDWVLAGAPKE